MGQIQSLEELINFLRRRAALVLSIALIGAALAALYAKTRPNSFEAVAAIQVQGAQIAMGQSEGSSAELMQSIEHRLTRREALLQLIDRQALYTEFPALLPEEKVALLRQSISFQGVEAAGSQTYGRPTALSAILIAARDGSADKAARIANDLAQSVLDLSSSGQIENARLTYDFYVEEQQDLSLQIRSVDADLASYKSAHAEALPEVTETRRNELASLEVEIRALDQQIVIAVEEQRQIESNGTLRVTGQRKLEDLSAQLSVLNEQRIPLANRQLALQDALTRLPDIDRALRAMERDRSLLQTRLDAAALHVGEAESAMRLAERQHGERLALLDRAVVPAYPQGAGRKKIFVLGAVASLMIGLGLAFMLDLLHPVVRTARQMERQLGLRPVIAMPAFDLPQGKDRQKGGGR